MSVAGSLHKLIPILLLLIIAGACGNNNDEDADASELVERAADRFAETDTAQFALDIDGSVAIDEGGMLSLSAVEGRIERPASAQADASVQFAGSNVTLEMVAVDGEMYLRNIVTGGWERAPSDLEYDPARIFDEQQGISAILDQLEDLETEGQESVNGEDAWHVVGSVDAQTVRPLTGRFFEGDSLDVELWIAEDDYRLLRVELHDTAGDSQSWRLELTHHDKPVDITPPDSD